MHVFSHRSLEVGAWYHGPESAVLLRVDVASAASAMGPHWFHEMAVREVVVTNFAALPPEVNSARMYAGAGSGPLVAAAAAWEGLAAELSSAATSYRSAITELSGGPWLGPASAAMAQAGDSYTAWITTTATHAEQTATQAKAAAAAYQAAFLATVPPPVVAANRALLTALVATNILGQNTPAIAATETDYADMWAQDAAAMYGYAGASAAATQMTPFSAAPQNTNDTGSTAQAATTASAGGGLTQTLSSVPTTLNTLATGAQTTDPITQLLDWLNSPLNVALNTFTTALAQPITQSTGPMFAASGALYQVAPLFTSGLQQWAAAVHGVPDAVAIPQSALEAVLGNAAGSSGGVAGLGGAEVSADLGRAGAVGGLSVPQSWASASPDIRLAAKALPLNALEATPVPAAAGPGGWVGGIPPIGPVGSVVNAPRHSESRPRTATQTPIIAREPGAGRVSADPSGPRMAAGTRGSDALPALSDQERDELIELRREFADVSMQRDAVARLIKEAMRP